MLLDGDFSCWWNYNIRQAVAYIHDKGLETENKRSSRRPILAWLIISQALAVACLFFWLLVAGLSVMVFDAGVTAEAWTFVILVWAC